jgi:nucleotide-binding universal stress UspA family protein
MSDYRVVVVGTDGSDTSLRAVDRAAGIAAQHRAKLVVATAYVDARPQGAGPDPDQARNPAGGNADTYGMLRDAAQRARAAGATDVEERAVEGAPIDVLLQIAEDAGADLIVVGNVGANSLAGRVLGSVPQTVKKRASTEVLVVDTAD